MNVRRTKTILKADPSRVLLRPLHLGDEAHVRRLAGRVIGLADEAVDQILASVRASFENRHRHLETFWQQQFERVRGVLGSEQPINPARQLLIGAYFTMEYSLEAAALFNPSMVWHPDQSGLPAGHRRFIISLRATGEGHISSLTFRMGVIDAQGNLNLDPPSCLATLPEYRPAGVNYEAFFSPELPLPERVLFPFTPAEQNGMEDIRLVRFQGEAGQTYYATYTAYTGREIRPYLLETCDFLHFKVSRLEGPAAENKGMALFPCQINGRYMMISRQDNENIYLMASEQLGFWEQKQLLLEPAYPWEFIKLGNCGSPLETEAGWLVLSHGVGPMRQYAIGAFLLDRDDPGRVIGRLREPLLVPDDDEREGYVPNVVYSCGGLIHKGELILPYAMSDTASKFARIEIEELLAALT